MQNKNQSKNIDELHVRWIAGILMGMLEEHVARFEWILMCILKESNSTFSPHLMKRKIDTSNAPFHNSANRIAMTLDAD